MQLREPEHEREHGDEDDPTTDTEEPGEHAADQPGHDDGDDDHRRSLTATATSKSEKP